MTMLGPDGVVAAQLKRAPSLLASNGAGGVARTMEWLRGRGVCGLVITAYK